jgi:hypothetical protein
MARPLCTAAPERRRVHLDHAPQGDGADTPRRDRASRGGDADGVVDGAGPQLIGVASQ